MTIYASTLITFIALIYYSVLLVVILRQKNYDRPRLFFSLYLVSMIIWSFAAFMIFADWGSMDTLFLEPAADRGFHGDADFLLLFRPGLP